MSDARTFSQSIYCHTFAELNVCLWFFVFSDSVFLAEQFESLQSHLDTMMPAAKKPFLQQFYSQVL